MKNTTTNPSNSQTLNLNEDTQIYLCAQPRVRVFEIDIFDSVGSILNFRAGGLRVAREIIRRQGGENISIELTHENLAEALWPDLASDARVRKFTRSLKNYREDMDASGFCFMNPKKQKPKMTEDGFRGLPTLYEPGDYWRLSNAVQERAKEVDFFALPVDKRRRKERDELKMILKQFGCVRIVRVREKAEKSEKQKSEKPASLPCACDCASCVHCASKSATASEAERARPAQERITKSDVIVKMGTAFEILFDSSLTWMNLNLDRAEFWRKVNSEIGILDQRLADAMKRANTPRKLKLVGGQSR